MRLLIVSGTESEIAPLLGELTFYEEKGPRLKSYEMHGKTVDVLITGIGMTATAAWVAQTLTSHSYSAALNVGLCGSFDRNIALGEVIVVATDRIAYLGAEDDDRFLTLQDLQLESDNDFPFCNGVLQHSTDKLFSYFSEKKKCNGITVNRVHGRQSTINDVVDRLHPQVESMEGSGFYYACAIAGVPGLQIRCVSNYVEKRNRAKWELGTAIENLNSCVLGFLNF